jgi:hypothetical protein
MKALRIPQWHIKHGPPDPRVKTIQWVTTPTSQDSLGLKRIKRMPDGMAIYGIYQLMVQLAASLPVRGMLWCDRGPMTAEDIAERLDIDLEQTKRAIEVLSSERIGWVDDVEIDGDGNPICGWPENPAGTTDDPHPTKGHRKSPGSTGNPRGPQEIPGVHGKSPGSTGNPRGPQEIPGVHGKSPGSTGNPCLHEHEHEKTRQDITEHEHAQTGDTASTPAPVDPKPQAPSLSPTKNSNGFSGSGSQTPDDGTRRKVGRMKWLAKVQPLFSRETKQRESDITSAGNIFDQDIWPDDIDSADGEQALKRALDLADRAARARKPMAYITSEVGRARAPAGAGV